MFYPRLSENFPFSFYFFENALKLQNDKFLAEKSKSS